MFGGAGRELRVEFDAESIGDAGGDVKEARHQDHGQDLLVS